MASYKFPFKSPSDLNDFVVLDLETTGLSSRDCEIIQLSAVRYVNHREVDSFSSYIHPKCCIPPSITELTGISDATVSDAPAIDEVLGEFICFLLKSPYVTGYNIKFDLGFVDAAVGGPISEHLVWFDTMLLTRRSLSLPRYRLADVCEYIGYNTIFHDALSDCRACGEVLNYLCKDNRMDHALHSKAERLSAVGNYLARCSSGECPLKIDTIKRGGALDGKAIVFTGALSFSRSQAKSLAEAAGAIVKGDVSKKIQYLVLGEQDEIIVGCNAMSYKEEKARALIDAGREIKIIDEATFLDILSHAEEATNEAAELI